MKIKFKLISIALFLCIYSETLCSQSSRVLGLGNIISSHDEDPLSSFSNPASNVKTVQTSLVLGSRFGLFDFKNIYNIKTKEGDARSVSTQLDPEEAVVFGVTVPVYEKWNHLLINTSLYLPSTTLYRLDSPKPYEPHYPFYFNQKRFAVSTSLGFYFVPNFRVGFGADVYLKTAGNIDINMGMNSNNKREFVIRDDINLALAPNFGVQTDITEYWRFSFVYRGEQDSYFRQNVATDLQSTNGTPLVDFKQAHSNFYVPRSFTVGGRYHILSWTWLGEYSRVLYEKYKSYLSQFHVNSTEHNLPQTNFKNINVLKTALTYSFPSYEVGMGYSFVPTPVSLNDDFNLFADSDKEIITVYFRKVFETISWLNERTLSLDLFSQIQFLQNRRVTNKTSTEEGYPGYDVGGVAYRFGLDLSVLF